MSISLSSFNLWSIMGTVNEWMDRETRPITWHKLQLVLHKIDLDLARGAGGEVAVVDLAGAAGVLEASSPAVQLIDPNGSVDLLASSDIEKAAVRWSAQITNTAGAAETITFKDSTGTTTVGTIAQGETKIVYWDGTAWGIGPAL
jgi:hypothetical protein